MRSILVALMVAVGLSGASLAAELQPKTVELLITLGYDPKSPMITQIAGDKVGTVSLDSLADRGDRENVKRFIVTRNFARRYRADANLPFPSPLEYSDRYFTPDEVAFFVARRIKLRCAAEKIPSGKMPPGSLQPCP